MHSDSSNPSTDPEQNVKTEATGEEVVIEDAVEPRDLVMKGGYTLDPEEIVDNPAVTPEMPEDFKDLRGDLRKD